MHHLKIGYAVEQLLSDHQLGSPGVKHFIDHTSYIERIRNQFPNHYSLSHMHLCQVEEFTLRSARLITKEPAEEDAVAAKITNEMVMHRLVIAHVAIAKELRHRTSHRAYSQLPSRRCL